MQHQINSGLLFAIATGGAIGAVARYLVMSMAGHMIGHGFPWGTVIVNVAGSFILGALIETMALVWSPSEAIRAMLIVGVLGSFTTFSTFSLDIQSLITRGEFVLAGGYILGSVIAGVVAFLAGMALFRIIWS
jgi:CrcB protein